MKANDVITGKRQWSVEQADVLEFLRSLPADSVDLVFGSPPYELARLYLEGGKNLGVARKTEAWVAWMVEVWTECQRVCKGLVAFVVEGQTKQFHYSAGPLLLAADLHRAGFNLRKPAAFCRVGIPGSGGPDWLRNDYEFIICTTRPGKLPWSDNTACGHRPKWAPGGEMSSRLSNGTRVNQWGRVGSVSTNSRGQKPTSSRGENRPSHEMMSKAEKREESSPGLFDGGEPKIAGGRKKGVGTATRGKVDGDAATMAGYDPPVLANPGNLIKCLVGGGQMGNDLAHRNEAPYPEKLCEFFIRSFCPDGGIVVDPFSGSGTTGAVAIRWHRRFIGCDLRESQVELSRKRIGQEVGMFSAEIGEA